MGNCSEHPPPINIHYTHPLSYSVEEGVKEGGYTEGGISREVKEQEAEEKKEGGGDIVKFGCAVGAQCQHSIQLLCKLRQCE